VSDFLIFAGAGIVWLLASIAVALWIGAAIELGEYDVLADPWERDDETDTASGSPTRSRELDERYTRVVLGYGTTRRNCTNRTRAAATAGSTAHRR